VVVTAPVPGVDPRMLPMVFDVTSGIYWRPGEEGGLLWGMSNPDEQPGRAREFDHDYYQRMRARVAALYPATAGLGVRRSWAATIDYTPDHLPIIGPLLRDGEPVAGTVVASAGGHGMMWGPGVARARRPGPARPDRPARPHRPRPRPVRRRRTQPPGCGPDRPPLPAAHPVEDPLMDTPHVTDVATAELEDWGPLEEATGPEMTTRGVDLWVDGPLSGGIWECTPGPSYWTQDEHEVIHLVAGRMTVTPDGGEPTELGAGDMAVFPKGWSGTWEIHETVRKVYAIF